MATHSSVLAWKIPGTRDPGGLASMGSQSRTRLSPITSWQIDGETVETVSDFIFLGSKITADGDCFCFVLVLDSAYK